MTGTLEHIDGVVEFTTHAYVADTIDGGFADMLPRFNDKPVERWAGAPGESNIWSGPQEYGRGRSAAPTSSDKLHGYCQCKGVEFWVARPTERSKEAAGSWPDVLIPYHSAQARPTDSTWWLRNNGTKLLAGACACNSCRLGSGMEWMHWSFMPTVDISQDADGRVPFSLDFGSLKAYQSSRGAMRYFCATCGASMFYNNNERTDLIDVAMGTLDAAEGARAETWLDLTTTRLSYREDALSRAQALTVAVEQGLKEYGTKPR